MTDLLEAHHEAHGGDESPDREDCPICITAFNEAYREHYAPWRAERELRQSLALARADLDMAGVDEWPELMDAIQARFK
jgi:hypothetical protein